jgi:predicted DCC family thiol-disulfide oxidoreductase YuxK
LSARDTSRQKTSLASSISVPPPQFSNNEGKQSSSSSYVVSRVVSGNRRLTEEEQRLIDACFGAIDRDAAIDDDNNDEIHEDWKRPIFLFDGICNFCSQSVSVCYDWDIEGVLRFAPLQSPTGRALLKHFGKSPDDLSSLVLVVDRNTAYFESDAVLQIASRLGGLPPILKTITRVSKFVPRGIRNKVYHVVADRRYMFGEADGPTCRVDLNPARFVDQVTPEYEI